MNSVLNTTEAIDKSVDELTKIIPENVFHQIKHRNAPRRIIQKTRNPCIKSIVNQASRKVKKKIKNLRIKIGLTNFLHLALGKMLSEKCLNH